MKEQLELNKILIVTHHLVNFETKAYSRNNLPKIKSGAYQINLDEYESIGILWIALYVNAENVTYLLTYLLKYT